MRCALDALAVCNESWQVGRWEKKLWPRHTPVTLTGPPALCVVPDSGCHGFRDHAFGRENRVDVRTEDMGAVAGQLAGALVLLACCGLWAHAARPGGPHRIIPPKLPSPAPSLMCLSGSGWEVRNMNGSIRLPAAVPGCTLDHLQAAQLIPDPLFRCVAGRVCFAANGSQTC